MNFSAAGANVSCASTLTPGVEIFGWVGCAAAWLLFIAPLPTMRKIVRAGNTGDFSPVPYLVSALQCGLWAVYALPFVTPCKLQPLVTNAIGSMLELSYVLLFIAYAPTQRRRMCLVVATLALALALGAISAGALLIAPKLPITPWPDPKASKTTTVLGLICIVLNIAMYASPLVAVRTVIRSRSVTSMPLPLTIGCGFCSGCWFAYALLVGDDFILVPNAAGLALFCIQLSVYRYHSPFCVRARDHASASDPLVNKQSREALLLPSSTDDTAASPYPGGTFEPMVSPVADTGGGSSGGGGGIAGGGAVGGAPKLGGGAC